MSVAECFCELRNALVVCRRSNTVQTRVRLFSTAKLALDVLKHADAGFVHGDLESLSAELAAALRTLRRGLPRENAQRHGSGLKTGRTRRAKHLSVKGAGHAAKRATRKGNGNSQPEAQAEPARAA